MDGGAVQRRLSWQAAEVLALHRETPSACRLTLRPPAWTGHVPGQHVDVRLTAPDGYSAKRSYSIASAPGSAVQLVVDRLDDGEVSPYLTDELRPGDGLEIRGPFGGYFVWPAATTGPVQLIAGGSGVVPFLSMLGHHRAADRGVPTRLLYSARTVSDVIAQAELDDPQPAVAVTITLTRGAPPGWLGPTGRVDAPMLTAHTFPAEQRPEILVCGPTSFVEAVAQRLTDLGHEPQRIRTERFGASGGP